MLQNASYCPILYSRVAEMKALSQLPAASKDNLMPIIVARPWPNAKSLSRTWEKIGEAIGQRRFGLDLDQTRRGSENKKPVSVEFDALFNGEDGFKNYYDLIKSVPFAVPVLRIRRGEAHLFDEQVNHISELDRGVIVRIEHDVVGSPSKLVDDVLAKLSDVVIFIDAGWSNDLLSRELWASQLVQRASDISPEVEIVVSGSSFPDSFTNIAERGVLPVRERVLYSNLVRRHNAARLVYSDWGSTRPPYDPTPMRNVPRIDLPTNNDWIVFRRSKDIEDEEEAEEYSDIAVRVIEDSDWPSHLKIWGTYIISCTAEGLPGAIKSPAVAAAARINIHLHRQSFYDAEQPINDDDEPFTDD